MNQENKNVEIENKKMPTPTRPVSTIESLVDNPDKKETRFSVQKSIDTDGDWQSPSIVPIEPKFPTDVQAQNSPPTNENTL
ncbi:MAG: hypothetical protein WA160_09240 [Pseudobdellovibrio sp.]